MNPGKVTSLLTVVVIAAVLSACKERGYRGPTHTETRQVGSFDSVDIEGNARVEIAIGEKASLSLEGAEKTLRRLETDVHGDTLKVRSRSKRDWVWGDDGARVTVKITMPELESLKLRGGNDVRITGYAGGESKIKVEGAARIRGYGRLDELTVDMEGAGHADLSQLIANEAKITVDGVGSVYVHPRDSLDATMNGVGAILYSGSPRDVSTHMNGIGTIGRRDERNPAAKAEPETPTPKIDPDDLDLEYDRKKELLKGVGSTETI